MIIGDLAVAYHHVMREHSAHSFVESASNGILWHFEFIPCPGVPGIQLFERLLDEIQRCRGCIRLEVRACAIPLDGITPLGNFPLELRFRQQRGFGQIDDHALARRLDVSDVPQP